MDDVDANLVTQFYWNIKNNESPVIYGDGTQRRDFIHVSDLVEIILRASQLKGFNVINGGTGKNYSLNEMLTMLNKQLGIKLRHPFCSNSRFSIVISYQWYDIFPMGRFNSVIYG